jgi:hypothetical protein
MEWYRNRPLGLILEEEEEEEAKHVLQIRSFYVGYLIFTPS